MNNYGEWCPVCKAPIVSVTRGIPSMGTCANGHKTDRRDVLRREPEPTTNSASAQPLGGPRRTDNDMIRRGDMAEILLDEGWYGNTLSRLAAIPAAPVFTAADLEAAFRVGKAASGLAAANTEIGFHDGISGDWHPMDGPSIISAVCSGIRALTPPPDLAERVKQEAEGK